MESGSAPLSVEAIGAFKEQLGIHPAEDSLFGWIAEVGLRSPLPPRCTSHVDEESGFIYYIDHDRQTSTWENPLVPHLRRIVEVGRTYVQNPFDGFFEDQKGVLWHQHKHSLDAWHGPFTDPEGRQYFVNASEEVSSWQDPRVDAQYIFELEVALLTSMEEVLPKAGLAPEDSPWEADGGAQVLTLDGLSARAKSGLSMTATFKNGWRKGATTTAMNLGATGQLKLVAHQTAEKEHTTVMEEMTDAAKRLEGIQQDEEEAQRLAFAKKLEERRLRRAAASRAGGAGGERPASRLLPKKPPPQPTPAELDPPPPAAQQPPPEAGEGAAEPAPPPRRPLPTALAPLDRGDAASWAAPAPSQPPGVTDGVAAACRGDDGRLPPLVSSPLGGRASHLSRDAEEQAKCLADALHGPATTALDVAGAGAADSGEADCARASPLPPPTEH